MLNDEEILQKFRDGDAKKQRFVHIDALRAIAATSVLFQHFFGDVVRHAVDPLAPLVAPLRYSLESFDLGRFGVVLFFLISGFVVPFSIRGNRRLQGFAISRFFRLYPASWLAVFTLCAVFIWQGAAVSPLTVLANLTMLPAFLGQPWLSGIYWTLSIEIVFYTLSAALFAGDLLFRPLAVTAFTLALVGSTAVPIALRLMGHIQLPVQYIGMHVSYLFVGLLRRMALADRVKWAGAGAIIVILTQFSVLMAIGDFSLARDDSFFMVGKMPIILAYAAAFILFGLSILSEKSRSIFLAGIGAISYSIYLFHGVVALIVYHYLPLTGNYGDLAVGMVSTALTFIVSWLIYNHLEIPMILLGKNIANNRPTPTVIESI